MAQRRMASLRETERGDILDGNWFGGDEIGGSGLRTPCSHREGERGFLPIGCSEESPASQDIFVSGDASMGASANQCRS